MVRARAPVKFCPPTASTVNIAGSGRLTYSVAVLEPAAPTWQPAGGGVKALFAPAHVMVTPVRATASAPAFVTSR